MPLLAVTTDAGVPLDISMDEFNSVAAWASKPDQLQETIIRCEGEEQAPQFSIHDPALPQVGLAIRGITTPATPASPAQR